MVTIGTWRRVRLGAGAILVAGLAPVDCARAASATWTGLGADSEWTTTANWSASPVPGAGDTATFNGAGNGRTTITTAPASLYSYLFDSASCVAYTISGPSTTWSLPDSGGVTINSTVATHQDLSGILYIRPAINSTAYFANQGSGTLKLGTFQAQNTGSGTTLARLSFTPASGATIEIITGKLVDNAGTGGRCKMSVLLDDDGILKIAATGTYDGSDAEGNSVTIHRGTLQAYSINVIGTARTSLGANGRIQFGEVGQTRTATLDYYNTANATTDRSFYLIDNNTAVFKVSGSASTRLEITSGITQSGSANGGGKLTKDGAGTLILSGANTHSGGTTVQSGTLLVNNTSGSGTGSGTVTVNNGGTLGGTGRVSGAVTVKSGGKLAPGGSVGTNTVGSLALESGSTFDVEVSGAVCDLTISEGNVDLGGATLSVSSASPSQSGYVVLRTPGTLDGTFNGLSEGTAVPGMTGYHIHYLRDGGTKYVILNTSPTAVVLHQFGAMAEGSNVVVRWRTASEIGTVGFDLYRRVDGEWVRVNDGMIAATGAPNGGLGASYSLVDAGAVAGGTYEYKLVETEQDGGMKEYGPYPRTATALELVSPIRPVAEGIELRWLSRDGERYRILRSTNLLDSVMHTVADGVAPTPPENVFLDPGDAPIRVYRVERTD